MKPAGKSRDGGRAWQDERLPPGIRGSVVSAGEKKSLKNDRAGLLKILRDLIPITGYLTGISGRCTPVASGGIHRESERCIVSCMRYN